MADEAPKSYLTPGEVHIQIAATKDGVAIVCKPPLAATFLTAEQARNMAQQLRRNADSVEQYEREQRRVIQ